MIVYEGTAPAAVRRGEFHPFAGARGRVRALPYPGYDAPGGDPWRGTYRRPVEIATAAGPSSPDAWSDAFARAAAGRILVGPAAPAEPVYGAAAAAVEAARRLGRASVLVETADRATNEIAAGPDLARVVVWDGTLAADEFWERFAGGARPSGVALPWIPGWTGEEDFLAAFFGAAAGSGAAFAAGFPLSGDGASRAAIHGDFAARHPDRADAFFDAVHHRDWDRGTDEARSRFRALAARAGIPARIPPLVGRRDFEANARLADAFESEAEAGEEPRASALLAAARRVEDFDRDVADLEREGNLRILWPPGSPEARLARAVLAGIAR